jgi:hypothetical protein
MSNLSSGRVVLQQIFIVNGQAYAIFLSNFSK